MIDDQFGSCPGNKSLKRLIIKTESNVLHRANLVSFASTRFKMRRKPMRSNAQRDRFLDPLEFNQLLAQISLVLDLKKERCAEFS